MRHHPMHAIPGELAASEGLQGKRLNCVLAGAMRMAGSNYTSQETVEAVSLCMKFLREDQLP